MWASFGAASNLAARLNEKPLPLPTGTYSALVGTSGLELLDSSLGRPTRQIVRKDEHERFVIPLPSSSLSSSSNSYVHVIG